MIQHNKIAKHRRWIRPLIFLGVLLLSALAIFFALKFGQHSPKIDAIYCDAEKTEEKAGHLFFKTGEDYFFGGKLQSAEMAHSGKFSCKLEKGKEFGLTYELKNLMGGEEVLISVWRYNPHGLGAMVLDGDWKFYWSTAEPFSVGEKDWEELVARVKVPDTLVGRSLKVYCWYPDPIEEPVYFDDLRIEILKVPRVGIPRAIGPGRGTLAERIRAKYIPIKNYTVRAHLERESNGIAELKVVSFFPEKIEVLGIGKTEKAISVFDEKGTEIPCFDGTPPPRFYDVSFRGIPKYLYYRIPGDDSVYSELINPWPLPGTNSPRQELFANLKLSSNDLYSLEGNEIIFSTGKHSISKPLVFPAGRVINIPAGCELQFNDSSFFLSLSPVRMMGTAQFPVLVSSPDGTARGFTVLQANTESVLSHVSFENFGTLDYKNWVLTGAVTFYESPVKMNHVKVAHNTCEDALNLVRSQFDISHLLIEATFSDGLDVDFCKGILRNSIFRNTGNDGADFSGSVVTLDSVAAYHPGDKGISVGEQATVTVNQLLVEGAAIGLASKDLSLVTATDVTFRNCKIGFAAYQKKPEFGPGKIIAKGLKLEAVERQTLSENGSVIQID